MLSEYYQKKQNKEKLPKRSSRVIKHSSWHIHISQSTQTLVR